MKILTDCLRSTSSLLKVFAIRFSVRATSFPKNLVSAILDFKLYFGVSSSLGVRILGEKMLTPKKIIHNILQFLKS